nr:MAG TPA: hypothetical protein [Caudoviricetes sp.]
MKLRDVKYESTCFPVSGRRNGVQFKEVLQIHQVAPGMREGIRTRNQRAYRFLKLSRLDTPTRSHKLVCFEVACTV